MRRTLHFPYDNRKVQVSSTSDHEGSDPQSGIVTATAATNITRAVFVATQRSTSHVDDARGKDVTFTKVEAVAVVAFRNSLPRPGTTTALQERATVDDKCIADERRIENKESYWYGEWRAFHNLQLLRAEVHRRRSRH